MGDEETRIIERAAADGDPDAIAWLARMRERVLNLTDDEVFERAIRDAFLTAGRQWPTGRNWTNFAARCWNVANESDDGICARWFSPSRVRPQVQALVVSEPDRVTVGITRDTWVPAAWLEDGIPASKALWHHGYALWAAKADPTAADKPRDRAQATRDVFAAWVARACDGLAKVERGDGSGASYLLR